MGPAWDSWPTLLTIKQNLRSVAGTASWKHALKILHMAGWATGSYWPS